MKKSLLLFLPLLLFTMLFCSCTQKAVNNQADELRINSWSGKGEYSTTVHLSFEGSKASFDIHSMGGADTRLYGDCVIDEDKIMLTDSRLKNSLEFDYEIKGNEVTLSYDGGTIYLNKD